MSLFNPCKASRTPYTSFQRSTDVCCIEWCAFMPVRDCACLLSTPTPLKEKAYHNI